MNSTPNQDQQKLTHQVRLSQCLFSFSSHEIFSTRLSEVPYEIKVYTSNKSNAGTDANVHIEIYGMEQSTGQVMLCSKTDRKGKFQQGSIDVFVLELDDVGDEIEKIRIGHDNKGFGKKNFHEDFSRSNIEFFRLNRCSMAFRSCRNSSVNRRSTNEYLRISL